MKPMPSVVEVMTILPQTIALDQTLQHAQAVMSGLNIRHLPVVDEGRLVGIVSDRDIRRALSIETDTGNIGKLTVADFCEFDVYWVKHTEKISSVAQSMAENKYGCAVVVNNDKVVGIFTTTDACRLLAESLHQLYPDA